MYYHSSITRQLATAGLWGCRRCFQECRMRKIGPKRAILVSILLRKRGLQAASVEKKMIRGISFARRDVLTGIAVLNADGSVVAPVEIGEPPEWKNNQLLPRQDCTYTPDGDIFTKPGALQIVLTNVDGGVGGSEVTITKERSVSRSTTFEAGLDWKAISASVSVTFEESITNGNEKKFNVPAGQSGKLGFTPTLKCTKGSSPSSITSLRGHADYLIVAQARWTAEMVSKPANLAPDITRPMKLQAHMPSSQSPEGYRTLFMPQGRLVRVEF